MFFNKFYISGSVLSIPQHEFGDRIKPGTFTLRDNSTATEIKIIDDLNGNLYWFKATHSQSCHHYHHLQTMSEMFFIIRSIFNYRNRIF